MNNKEILQKSIDLNASDIQLSVGRHPIYRVDGRLREEVSLDVMTPELIKSRIEEILNEEQKDLLNINKEMDFSFNLANGARFRINAFFERGNMVASFRRIPLKIPSFKDLNLPDIMLEFCKLPQGLVLITGPSGQGKSTTLASLIDYINKTRAEHIITIEDPVEYIFKDEMSLIRQREMHVDTHSWGVALRSVLREDPNVLLVGEMRDLETISSAITIAETGHLVFATLHTNSAAQSIDRIIDVFPEHQQQQVRVQLSQILEGIVSQRLISGITKGRYPAVEVLIATPAIRNLIREKKTHQIDNTIATSADIGMQTLEKSLADLVNTGKITLDEAKRSTLRPSQLARLIGRS